MGLFDFIKKNPESVPGGVKVTQTEHVAFKSGKTHRPISEMNPSDVNLKQRIMSRMRGKVSKTVSLSDYVSGSHSVSGALMQLWTKSIMTRREYAALSAQLKSGSYIVDAILQCIADDTVYPDSNGVAVKFMSEDTELQAALDELQENIDFTTLLNENMYQFAEMSEYFWRMTVVAGKGVVAIDDDLDQLNILALYEGGYPAAFLVNKEGIGSAEANNRQTGYTIEPPTSYVHFVAGTDKLRYRVTNQLYMTTVAATIDAVQTINVPEELKKRLPDYIKVGKPFFLYKVQKLRELQLLENIAVAMKLNQATQSQFVSVKVPPGITNDELGELLERFENILNPPVGVDLTTAQVSAADIISASSKLRLLPDYTDEKGRLEVVNVRKMETIDDLITLMRDLRSIITSSIGIPASLLFGSFGSSDGNETATKTHELRLFSRYTRMLARYQRALARGLEQVVLAHISNLGVEFKSTEFRIVFTQTLVDVAGLERQEFEDAKLSLIINKFSLIKEMLECPITNKFYSEEGVLDWLQESFEIMSGGGKLLLSKEEREQKRELLKKQEAEQQHLLLQQQQQQQEQPQPKSLISDPYAKLQQKQNDGNFDGGSENGSNKVA